MKARNLPSVTDVIEHLVDLDIGYTEEVLWDYRAAARDMAEELANAQAAMAWSTPTDVDPEDIVIIAKFNGEYAVNGDPVSLDDVLKIKSSNCTYVAGGGRVSAVEEEVTVEFITRALGSVFPWVAHGTELIQADYQTSDDYIYLSVSGDVEMYRCSR